MIGITSEALALQPWIILINITWIYSFFSYDFSGSSTWVWPSCCSKVFCLRPNIIQPLNIGINSNKLFLLLTLKHCIQFIYLFLFLLYYHLKFLDLILIILSIIIRNNNLWWISSFYLIWPLCLWDLFFQLLDFIS